MPGWSCHCNATATNIAPVRTQHAPVTGTSTYARKSWGGHPRCDLAPQSTSFGTVALRERQHLAMAGSRHNYSPRNATAHRAARANYHVPHCSVLADDVRTCQLLTDTVTRCIRCMRRGYEGCLVPIPFSRLLPSLVVMFAQRVLTIVTSRIPCLRAVQVTALPYFRWSMLFLPECQWRSP